MAEIITNSPALLLGTLYARRVQLKEEGGGVSCGLTVKPQGVETVVTEPPQNLCNELGRILQWFALPSPRPTMELSVFERVTRYSEKDGEISCQGMHGAIVGTVEDPDSLKSTIEAIQAWFLVKGISPFEVGDHLLRTRLPSTTGSGPSLATRLPSTSR